MPRDTFRQLNAAARDEDTRNRLKRIITSLNTLELQVEELEQSAKVIGNYEKNMGRLDLDIRVLTELIQEQVQEYIYYEGGQPGGDPGRYSGGCGQCDSDQRAWCWLPCWLSICW